MSINSRSSGLSVRSQWRARTKPRLTTSKNTRGILLGAPSPRILPERWYINLKWLQTLRPVELRESIFSVLTALIESLPILSATPYSARLPQIDLKDAVIPFLVRSCLTDLVKIQG